MSDWLDRAQDAVERIHGPAAAAHENVASFERFRNALVDPLYRRIDTLFGDRLICTRPHRVLAMQLERVGRFIIKPAVSSRIQSNKEHVLETIVMRTGTGVHADDVRAGDRIVVSQFAGSVWYDVDRGHESELWLFGSGDVIVKLIPDQAERTPLDELLERWACELEAL